MFCSCGFWVTRRLTVAKHQKGTNPKFPKTSKCDSTIRYQIEQAFYEAFKKDFDVRECRPFPKLHKIRTDEYSDEEEELVTNADTADIAYLKQDITLKDAKTKKLQTALQDM